MKLSRKNDQSAIATLAKAHGSHGALRRCHPTANDRDLAYGSVLRGVFHGLIGGVFGGPIAYITGAIILGYLHPSTHFMGTPYDIPLVMIVGAIVGALEGAVFGLLWAIKPPRLRFWWLMAPVAIVGLLRAILNLQSVLGLIALTVPVLMAISITMADMAMRARALSQIGTIHGITSQSCLLRAKCDERNYWLRKARRPEGRDSPYSWMVAQEDFEAATVSRERADHHARLEALYRQAIYRPWAPDPQEEEFTPDDQAHPAAWLLAKAARFEDLGASAGARRERDGTWTGSARRGGFPSCPCGRPARSAPPAIFIDREGLKCCHHLTRARNSPCRALLGSATNQTPQDDLSSDPLIVIS